MLHGEFDAGMDGIDLTQELVKIFIGACPYHKDVIKEALEEGEGVGHVDGKVHGFPLDVFIYK